MHNNHIYQQRTPNAATAAQDIQAMLKLLLARPQARQNDYPGRSDLLELWGLAETQANTRLWETTFGELVGFGIVTPSSGSLLFEVRYNDKDFNDYIQVSAAVLAWCAQQIRDAGGTSVHITSLGDNQARLSLLAEHGFVRKPEEVYHFRRVLAGVNAPPIPASQFPTGFTVQHLMGEDDVEQAVTLHRAAYGTENMTVDYRLSMMRVPDYDPELDLIAVAPDGQWVAFCIASIDDEENAQTGEQIGWLGVVGTHPAFQGRGLARALMLTAMKKLKGRGMELAGLGTMSTNVAMRHSAESVGFEIAARTIRFYKEL
ncbi:MAG: GNAT family N-acetyltransferase [Chloroflexota bacterium]